MSDGLPPGAPLVDGGAGGRPLTIPIGQLLVPVAFVDVHRQASSGFRRTDLTGQRDCALALTSARGTHFVGGAAADRWVVRKESAVCQ